MVYHSWEEFVGSTAPLLNCTPKNFYIEQGRIIFNLEMGGRDYFCEGSEDSARDYSFNPSEPIKYQCEFSSFYITDISSGKLICRW